MIILPIIFTFWTCVEFYAVPSFYQLARNKKLARCHDKTDESKEESPNVCLNKTSDIREEEDPNLPSGNLVAASDLTVQHLI